MSSPLPGRRRRALQRLDTLDRLAHARAAALHSPAADAVLPRVTRAADHGVLWLVVAAGLGATGGTRSRRAAVRGVMSLAVASAVANGPAKWAFRRTRPDLVPVPLPRRLRRQPQTTSFPSGHSASAAAFATGVALEAPVLAVPVGALAAAVAYGRVHTGVHYPLDVVAGVTLGAATAVALRRVWPVRPDRPAVAAVSRHEAPALSDGAGLVVVVNPASGSGNAEAVREQLAELLPLAEVVVHGDGDVVESLRRAAERARALGVAGGDGTVSAAAAVALDAGLPLAVIRAGTLDHFAAELGIDDVADAARAVTNGEAVEVSVGSAAPDGDGLHFLNTFSLGVYPELVRERERREAWLGKWPALAVALVRVLRSAEPVEVDVDDRRRLLWLLFVGNGHYHPSGFAPSWRERLDGDCVDVRLVDATRPWSRARLVTAVVTGRLGRCRVYEERVTDEVRIAAARGRLRIARDGEVSDAPPRLTVRAAQRRLVVYRPTED